MASPVETFSVCAQSAVARKHPDRRIDLVFMERNNAEKLVQLLEFALHERGGERQVFALPRDGRLTLAAENEAKEFLQFRIQRLARLAGSIDEKVERETAAPIAHCL